MEPADTQASFTGQILYRNLPVKVRPYIALYRIRAETVPVRRACCSIRDPIGHTVKNTGREMAVHREVPGRPVELASSKLNQALQAAIHMDGAWLFKHPSILSSASP